VVLLLCTQHRQRQIVQIQHNELAKGRELLLNRNETICVLDKGEQGEKYQPMEERLRQRVLLQEQTKS